MSDSQSLTFGVELEFICVRPENLFGNAGNAIHDTMRAYHIPVTGYEDLDSDDIDDFVFPSHTRWRVESDYLHLSEGEQFYLPDGWVAENIELSSRKFRFFHEAWRSEIVSVLKVLRVLEGAGCRFITNASTGFHVHVGYDAEHVPFPTAKKVFQVATAFERRIDEVHAVQRITVPEDGYVSHYYHPPSFYFRMDAQPDVASTNIFDRLAHLETFRSFSDLCSWFSVTTEAGGHKQTMNGHQSAYNFDNLHPDDEAGRYEETLTGTIEFRQHAGTLDELSIVAWVTLTCKLVEWCNTASATEMMDLCLRAADTDFELGHLLAELDVPADTIRHYLQHDDNIGVLPDATNIVAGALQNDMRCLIDQNDHEFVGRTDSGVLFEAIQRKEDANWYGYHSLLPVPERMVSLELLKALPLEVLEGRYEPIVNMSNVAVHVYHHFGGFYNRLRASSS